jgi:ATP-dependent helicase Lhr and Lhr-like helicase
MPTTMNSPRSPSKPDDAFSLLHPAVQRWVRDQGWAKLREVQEKAILHLSNSNRDLLISATTAAGKTEAAFLPLLGKTATRHEAGVSILYVAPLKALINDQFKRLASLCEKLETHVVCWHGDAPQGPKNATLKKPSGIVLITPESIEAMLIRRPASAEALFGNLDAIIVDELHAFLQGPRGLHLSSLLHRIELLNNRRPPRIGLSATMGDLGYAAKWLSSTAETNAEILAVDGTGPPLKLQIRGYIDPPKDDGDEAALGDENPEDALSQIADHAFGVLRGDNNLMFAGSRKNVEALADRLRQRSERERLPNEFFPHHGSLSRELREELETRLKDNRLPTTAIATTTLELGIDIGSVRSVAQYGPPRSLSSLKQRLGRSGRREGASAIFRNYVRERYLADVSDPLDTLRLPTIQAVAAIRLLLDRFVEPPEPDASLFSVAVHQVLSLIAGSGGAKAQTLYRGLCCPGPFAQISPSDFASLLKGMANGEEPLLEQAPDGTIMLGSMGERITSSRDFYANFQSNEEWRIVNQGRTLGTIPLINAFGVGSIVGFAGRRWRVTAVDDRAKVVDVIAHPAGRIPKFDRISGEPVHDRLAQEMRRVFAADDVPEYLDATAQQCLMEGRAAFRRLGLLSNAFLQGDKDVHVLTWRGSTINSVLAVLLTSSGIACESFDVGVTVTGASLDDTRDVLASIGGCPPIAELGPFVENLVIEKFDEFVPSELLRQHWVARHANLAPEITGLMRTLTNT